MATSLTRTLLDAHAVTARDRAGAPGAAFTLLADHVVLEGHAATLALLAFEALARPRAPLEAVLVGDGAGAPGAGRFESADERLYRLTAARHAGVAFVGADRGPVHPVYLARFAGPGRIALACAPGASAAGGLGTLVLRAGEIEAGAAIAGASITIATPRIAGVRLLGTLPPWAGGHDLACVLASRLAEARVVDGVLEIEGPGVASLAVAERTAVARAAPALGMLACLFPSDEVTRAWLKARGREPDWKPFATAIDADADTVIEIDLDSIEPMERDAATGACRPVGEVEPVALSQVIVGADADLADLLRFAALIEGRALALGVAVAAQAGTRAIAAALERSGAWSRLAAAGVWMLHPGAAPVAPPARGVTAATATSVTGPYAHATREVSIAAAACAAVTGRLGDPRGIFDAPPAVIEMDAVPPEDLWMPKAGDDAAPPVRGAAVHALPEAPPITTALRGPVLLALGERAAARRVLAGGPRVWRHASHIAELARHTFAEADPAFADRARRSRGGFVVAGGGFGEGARQPHAALALAELGVRAVLARSFAPGCVAALVRHGVLPLTFAVPDDTALLATGDEIEIPGLPEGLEPHKPLVVRDLTRGGQALVHHELGEREIETVRAGGWLQAVRATAALHAAAAV